MAIRTDSINIQALMAQAQSKLTAGTTTTPATQTGSGTESTAAEKVKKLAPSLVKAHERIAAQAQAASTSLSALGQFKSSLVDLGLAGKALVSLSATSTTQSVQSAVEKFVSKYNASVAKSTASSGANSTDIGVSRAMRELRAGLNGTGTEQPSLSRLGITQNLDGTLSLDTKALAKSMTANAAGTVAALARAGSAVDASADAALGADSRLSTSITSVGNRANELKAQETAVVNTATRLGEVYGSSSSWNRQVLDAYFKN